MLKTFKTAFINIVPDIFCWCIVYIQLSRARECVWSRGVIQILRGIAIHIGVADKFSEPFFMHPCLIKFILSLSFKVKGI